MSGHLVAHSDGHIKLIITLRLTLSVSKMTLGTVDKFNSCVTLDKLFNLSVPQFPHQKLKMIIVPLSLSCLKD